MAFLNWSFNLNTGIKQVDEEHILLVNSINDLHESYQTGDVNLVKAAYQKMLDITIMHFENEEKMLAENEYKMLDAHKQVHAGFIKRLKELQARYEYGDDEAMQEALPILEQWLFRHIKVNDGGYINDMKERGVE